MARGVTEEEQPDCGVDVRCSRCGVRVAGAQWAELPLVERILPRETRRLVLGWSDVVCIEVRSCGRCGHEIVAKCDQDRS
jgi:hypothetical protein